MNPISALTWLQAWYMLWCDGDWEHGYGVMIESQGMAGWTFSANLAGTALEGQPLRAGEQRRTENDWVTWELKGLSFNVGGGVWNLAEMVDIFREWVQRGEFKPRTVSSVSRFFMETEQTVPENLRELPWLEHWHRGRVFQQEQAHVKINTLDNPGWSLEVQLSREVAKAMESSVVLLPEGGRGWLDWRVKDNLLVSYAGPGNLIDQIEEFRSRIA